MNEKGVIWRAAMVVPLMITTITCVFGGLGQLMVLALGLPNRFHLPAAIRGGGIAVLVLGFLFLCWVFRYRHPVDILVSTFVTMKKAVLHVRPGATAERREPLVLQGPQRHVRHPMYFAVVVMVFGWWLALDYTLVLFMTLLFFLWFNLVVIPFEEIEMRALYKDEYEAYVRAVPRFVPSFRSRWRGAGGTGA